MLVDLTKCIGKILETGTVQRRRNNAWRIRVFAADKKEEILRYFSGRFFETVRFVLIADTEGFPFLRKIFVQISLNLLTMV